MKAPQRAMVAGALRQQMANALRRLRQPASIEQATRALRTLIEQTHERAHGGARVPAPGGSAEAWLPLVQTVERRLNEPSLCMPRRMASRASLVKA